MDSADMYHLPLKWPDKINRIMIPILLICVTATVYLPLKNHSFINFDDNLYVTDNQHVQKGLNPESIQWAFQLTESGGRAYWHPLTWISHMIDCQLFGVRAGMHHLVNLILHLLNICLLFILLNYMTGNIWKSAFVAALFGLHPINVDSVAWIAERKNLLSTVFWFISILGYAYYARRPSVYRYSLIVVSFILGLMAKPMLVTLPCVLLLMDFWPLNRLRWGQHPHETENPSVFHPASTYRLILEKLPLMALSFSAIIFSMISLQSHARIIDKGYIPFSLRISNAIISYVLYLKNMIWPENLTIFYPFPESIPLWKTCLAAVFLILFSAAVMSRAKKHPWLVTGWLWFLGTLVPVSGLIQGGLWPSLADRWAYIPLIGIFIIIAWGVPEIFKNLTFNKFILAISALTVLGLLVYKTSVQLGYWKNDYTLFSHALDVNENDFIAHTHLAIYYEKAENPEQAMYHFTKSSEIKPNMPYALGSFANFLYKQGDYQQALLYFNKALWLDPQDEQLYIGIGDLYLKQGVPEKAIYYYSQALQIEPESAGIHNRLAVAFLNHGFPEQAINEYELAINIKPDNPDFHYNLGLVKAKQGKTLQALSHFKSALKQSSDYIPAHLSIAEIMFQNGKWPEALNYYNMALQIDENDETIHYNIGVVLLRMDQPEKAFSHFKTALEINPEYEKAKAALTELNQLQ